MDPLHAWKDDFSREVEEVLASRARALERGEGAPSEGFGGRLADLVIPPAGAYAELRDAKRALELASAEHLELHERLETKEAQFAREREARERMKDGVAKLAVMLRTERAARLVAQAEAKKAWLEAEAGSSVLAAARLDADHASARAEDWEREAMARVRAARELQARIDRVLLDSDARDAELASLRARLDAALVRAQTSETEYASTRADAASHAVLASQIELERVEAQREAQAAAGRMVRAESSERAALSRNAALEAEMRLLSASCASFEREAQGLAADMAKARDEAAGASARERASLQALASERSRVQAETAAMMERSESLRAEGARALDRARRLEAELPVRLEAAMREERARLNSERETADHELQLAREARREAAARAADSEILLNETRAAAMRDAREQGQAAYASGLGIAQSQAEHAERALEASRRAEAAASEKARIAIAALAEYRDRAEASVAAARRAEASLQARLAGEVARRDAVLEEERATLRAQFEDTRAKLEDEMDAERRALRERWLEQTEALDRLRKDLERGRPGT